MTTTETTETTTDPNPEAVQQTLAEYERLAISTGATVQIEQPFFWSGRTDEAWTDAWVLADAPDFARVTVFRNGVPTTVVVSWHESAPIDEAWLELWLRKPMKMFGAYTIRAALRRAFRDVIGDRREPDERDTAPAAPESAALAPAEWFELLKKCATPQAVKELHHDAKQARAVTVELETAIRRRMVDVGGQVPTASKIAPHPISGARVAAVSVVADPLPGLSIEQAKPRPKPAPPTIRPEDTVRRPRAHAGAKGGKK